MIDDIVVTLLFPRYIIDGEHKNMYHADFFVLVLNSKESGP